MKVTQSVSWRGAWHQRGSLCFATATGGRDQDKLYPRGVSPRRVLAPLVALLAMTGVITGEQAGEIGV